jgi:hypothetical protein
MVANKFFYSNRGLVIFNYNFWERAGKTFKPALPVGLRVYLKKEAAAKLKRPYYSRSQLARQIIDFIIGGCPSATLSPWLMGGIPLKSFYGSCLPRPKPRAAFPLIAVYPEASS